MQEETRQAFTDAWNLYKKHYNVDKSDEFWEAFNEDAESIRKQHKDDVLIRGFIQAITADMKRRLGK